MAPNARHVVVLLGIVWLFLLFESSLLSAIISPPWVPNVGLLFVLAVALRDEVDLGLGAVCAFGIGALIDSFSGTPVSVHALTLLVAFLLTRLVATRLAFSGWAYEVVLSFNMTLVVGLLTWLLRSTFGDGALGTDRVILGAQLFGGATSTGLAALFIFPLYRRMNAPRPSGHSEHWS